MPSGHAVAVSSYPNPFNPTTSIVYELPGIQEIELKIYNVQGQVVATLDQGRKTAGVHSVEFNAEDLPTGLYMIHLNAGSQFVRRKIVLIR